MYQTNALLLTIASGTFFLISFFLVSMIKFKKEFSVLFTGIAFIMMIGMLFLDFIPEILETAKELYQKPWQQLGMIIIFIIIGLLLSKILDVFLPHHHHEHHEKEKNIKEHNHHSFHVGSILAISLFLHNFLEGISLFIIAKENITSGIVMAMGIGLHNLPLGLEIAYNISKEENKKMTFLMGLGLFSSCFLGALILYFFHYTLSTSLFFCFITIACGMILYITVFELLKEIIDYKKNKNTYIGIIIGILLILGMTFLK